MFSGSSGSRPARSAWRLHEGREQLPALDRHARHVAAEFGSIAYADRQAPRPAGSAAQAVAGGAVGGAAARSVLVCGLGLAGARLRALGRLRSWPCVAPLASRSWRWSSSWLSSPSACPIMPRRYLAVQYMGLERPLAKGPICVALRPVAWNEVRWPVYAALPDLPAHGASNRQYARERVPWC